MHDTVPVHNFGDIDLFPVGTVRYIGILILSAPLLSIWYHIIKEKAIDF